MNIQHALNQINYIEYYHDNDPIKHEVFFYFILLFQSQKCDMQMTIHKLNNSLLHYIDLSFLRNYSKENISSKIFEELYTAYKEGKL